MHDYVHVKHPKTIIVKIYQRHGLFQIKFPHYLFLSKGFLSIRVLGVVYYLESNVNHYVWWSSLCGISCFPIFSNFSFYYFGFLTILIELFRWTFNTLRFKVNFERSNFLKSFKYLKKLKCFFCRYHSLVKGTKYLTRRTRCCQHTKVLDLSISCVGHSCQHKNSWIHCVFLSLDKNTTRRSSSRLKVMFFPF